MEIISNLFLGIFSFIAISAVAQSEKTDTTKTVASKGSTRDLLMNASSASQPRQISLGLPLSTNAYIYEDGLPVSYYNFQLYPYKSWHNGVGHESAGTMTPQDMVLKYGVISYSVDSKSRITADKFSGRVNYTVNHYGRQAVDANIVTPISNGWGLVLNTYQNFDPGSNKLQMSYLKERMELYKGGISKTWAEGRGKAAILYQYASFMNLAENYGPFIFVGDGSVKEYNGFELGHDQYLPANNTFTYMDLMTGEMKEANINKANTDRIHNVNFVLDYTLKNGMQFYINSKFKSGHSNRANSTVSSILEATSESGYTYENGDLYVGDVQTRRNLVFDAFEHSWMTNVGLKGVSANRRHSWNVEADAWFNHGGTQTSMYLFATEVKADPKLLLLNGEPGYAYNSYAEYYNGHETKLFAFASDEWTVNDKLWLKAGLRLEYLNVRGKAANDVYEGNGRRNGFNLSLPGVELNHFNDNHFNPAYFASGRYALVGGLGLQAEFSSATIHSQLFHYGTYNYPSQKGMTSRYLRGGIYYKNNWVDLSSVLTYITMSNTQLRPQFSHILTKDVGNQKAGQLEVSTPTLYYGQAAFGWTTDAVFTPFPGFSFHALFTLRNPQYRDFDVKITYSDGVSEEYNFNGNTLTDLSKMEIELEPSYKWNQWRVWLSARYFSKQYINKTNSLYFNGRWETFGGVDYTLNKTVSFSASVINILNQKGASGSIASADLLTDASAYHNYLMSGTFIRPFTLEFTTKIKF